MKKLTNIVGVGDAVRLTAAPFKNTEAVVTEVREYNIVVFFELNGDRNWTAAIGEFEILESVPAPAVVIPDALTFSEDGYEDRGIHAMVKRLEDGVYTNKVRYIGSNEATKMTKVDVRAWRDAYNDEAVGLMTLFKHDILVAYGYDKHPVVEFWKGLVDHAWNDSHANGWMEILTTFDNLIDMFKGYDVIKSK